MQALPIDSDGAERLAAELVGGDRSAVAGAVAALEQAALSDGAALRLLPAIAAACAAEADAATFRRLALLLERLPREALAEGRLFCEDYESADDPMPLMRAAFSFKSGHNPFICGWAEGTAAALAMRKLPAELEADDALTIAFSSVFAYFSPPGMVRGLDALSKSLQTDGIGWSSPLDAIKTMFNPDINWVSQNYKKTDGLAQVHSLPAPSGQHPLCPSVPASVPAFSLAVLGFEV